MLPVITESRKTQSRSESSKPVKLPKHSFAYSAELIGKTVVGDPDLTIKVEGKEFYCSRAILEKVCELVRASEKYKDKDVLELKGDLKAYQVEHILEVALSGGTEKDMEADRAIRYFDLAKYLQVPIAENLYAQKYVRACLNTHKPMDPEQLVLMKGFFKKLDLSRLKDLNENDLEKIKTWEIESLDISRNTLSQKAFIVLAQIKSLKSLNVSHSPLLGDKEISCLTELPQLTSLDISSAGCLFDAESLPKLTALKNLHELKLNYSRKTGLDNLKALSVLPLTSLEVAGCEFKLEDLAGFTQLKRLNYSDHDKVKKEKIQEILPTLEKLIL